MRVLFLDGPKAGQFAEASSQANHLFVPSMSDRSPVRYYGPNDPLPIDPLTGVLNNPTFSTLVYKIETLCWMDTRALRDSLDPSAMQSSRHVRHVALLDKESRTLYYDRLSRELCGPNAPLCGHLLYVQMAQPAIDAATEDLKTAISYRDRATTKAHEKPAPLNNAWGYPRSFVRRIISSLRVWWLAVRRPGVFEALAGR